MFRQPSIEELAAEIAFRTGDEVIIEEVVEEVIVDEEEEWYDSSWEYSDEEDY